MNRALEAVKRCAPLARETYLKALSYSLPHTSHCATSITLSGTLSVMA
jgi:hypothetical protein